MPDVLFFIYPVKLSPDFFVAVYKEAADAVKRDFKLNIGVVKSCAVIILLSIVAELFFFHSEPFFRIPIVIDGIRDQKRHCGKTYPPFVCDYGDKCGGDADYFGYNTEYLPRHVIYDIITVSCLPHLIAQ